MLSTVSILLARSHPDGVMVVDRHDCLRSLVPLLESCHETDDPNIEDFPEHTSILS